jgi:hypothetical protein
MKIYKIAKPTKVRVTPIIKDKKPTGDPTELELEEIEADGCSTTSPSGVYSRYDVIQEREDIAPSMILKRKKQQAKEKGNNV